MGSSFGGVKQLADVPLLIDLYMAGKLKLDELISKALPLEEINTAFALMKSGEVPCCVSSRPPAHRNSRIGP